MTAACTSLYKQAAITGTQLALHEGRRAICNDWKEYGVICNIGMSSLKPGFHYNFSPRLNSDAFSGVHIVDTMHSVECI